MLLALPDPAVERRGAGNAVLDSAASTGNGSWMTLWLAIPVMVFSFNHSPIILPSRLRSVKSTVKARREEMCSKILAFAHTI